MAYRFLEHIVVGKRSPAKALHQELLSRLLDVAEEQVKDDGVKYHLEELGMCPVVNFPFDAKTQMRSIVYNAIHSLSVYFWRKLRPIHR